MLQVSNIHKSFAGDVILDGVSFTINRGERAGLIGPNGCGKTTLLRIILGQESPDRGSVRLGPGDVRVGYLAQALDYAPDATVGAVVKQAIAALGAAEQRVQSLAAAMGQAAGAELDAILADYDVTLADFERLGGYGIEARIHAILDGLGLRALGVAQHQIESVRPLGISSAIVVPLTLHGATVGAFAWMRSAPRPPFDDRDLLLAPEVGRRAGRGGAHDPPARSCPSCPRPARPHSGTRRATPALRRRAHISSMTSGRARRPGRSGMRPTGGRSGSPGTWATRACPGRA